jgi:hypothetical protein
MRYHVDLYLSTRQDPFHAAKVYTGLCRLARRGAITLTLGGGRWAGAGAFANNPVLVGLRVRAPGGRELRPVCINLHDRSDLFDLPLLRHCAVYFKRGFYRPDLERLPAGLRTRVVPFGFNYPCRSGASVARVLPVFAARYAAGLLTAPRRTLDLLRDNLQSFRGYLSLPDAGSFESGPGDTVEPVVVFQTRVWSGEQTAPDRAEEVNGFRVAVVRALRSAFGKRFWGGLVPTAYARKHYPDVLAERAWRQKEYIAMNRRSLVGVYTRGLHHSTAFKFGEYLAAAKCIVAEPLRQEPPAPLTEGRNYLPFRTPQECVARCAELLADPAAAAAMRRANQAYYRDQVEPAAHLLRCLERAVA